MTSGSEENEGSNKNVFRRTNFSFDKKPLQILKHGSCSFFQIILEMCFAFKFTGLEFYKKTNYCKW